MLIYSVGFVVAGILSFQVEEEQRLQSLAVVLEEAKSCEDESKKKDQGRCDDVIVASEERCLEHGAVELHERGMERLALVVEGDFAADYHVVEAYDVDDF